MYIERSLKIKNIQMMLVQIMVARSNELNCSSIYREGNDFIL